MLKQKFTYIPTPSIGWVSFADVDEEKICNVFKIPNNFGEVVQEGDEKWRSAIATEVHDQWSTTSREIQ